VPLDTLYTVVQKNAPTLADYNYDPVQSCHNTEGQWLVN